MITRQEFAVIDKEVKDCIQQTLDNIKANSVDNYVLFLADGEYRKEYTSPHLKISPFVIDDRVDKFKDETRLKFLANFLANFYSFPSSQSSTDDNEQRLHMELMIYSHIWESKPFLRKLHRLAHIVNKEEYNWNVIVPDMGKHDFIRNDIRKTLETNSNPLSEVIKKGFHTSLRNAFAHSDYSFDSFEKVRRIYLDNYSGESWELRDISFNDWSLRFVYSALLSFYLLDLTHKNRVNLINDFSTDTFNIKHPSSSGALNNVKITYRQKYDQFNFQQ
jgi:hypothetical protein